MKPVLQRIFARGNCEFVDETLQRERRLQRVDRPHPAERHRRLGQHVFDRVIGQAIYRSGFVWQIGIHSARNRLSFLSADGRRDDAMRERDGKS